MSLNDAEKEKEGKAIIEKIAKLKYELLHNRQLTYVPTAPILWHWSCLPILHSNKSIQQDLSRMMATQTSPLTTRN